MWQSALFNLAGPRSRTRKPETQPIRQDQPLLECCIEGPDRTHPMGGPLHDPDLDPHTIRIGPLPPTGASTGPQRKDFPILHRICSSRSLPALVPASSSPCPTAVSGSTTHQPGTGTACRPHRTHSRSRHSGQRHSIQGSDPGSRSQALGTGNRDRRGPDHTNCALIRKASPAPRSDLVEPIGIEPMTSCVQSRRSPS